MTTTVRNFDDFTTNLSLDLMTSTPSTFVPNSCENQTQSRLEEFKDRINVVVPYFVVLGIIGNSLSIITFSQRKLRTLSCGCYLLLLAIFDTIGLLIMSRPYFFKQFNIIHHLNSSFLCGLHFFLTKIFDELTPWLLVFVACNRLFLSRYPRNDQCFQTARAALWSTFVLLIILILINSHLLFGIGVGYSPLQPCVSVCGPLTKSQSYIFFYLNISPIIDLLLSTLVPFCIVFIANIFILVNVQRLKKQVVRTRRRKRANRNARLSIVLLADLITFLIVSLPVLLVECIYRFTRTTEHEEILDEYIAIGWIIANKILYLNYSLSFYFYVLTSSYFRHHFLLAIRCKKLHDIIFKTTQKPRQNCPHTTNFNEKASPIRLAETTKMLTNNCDLKLVYSPKHSVSTTITPAVLPLKEDLRRNTNEIHQDILSNSTGTTNKSVV